ncbi:hypothetical protein B0I35DRAFT_437555 [Stachybotrys elegans]|uniref:Uncharacterized protein n=1 Tax=Stachybotrys elegans TaxID=80388 RepID=A0A8K0SN12_9HYPO|nr:hypothetical protein B0I35DRAFT_437555 [Stachybotrys elegans]
MHRDTSPGSITITSSLVFLCLHLLPNTYLAHLEKPSIFYRRSYIERPNPASPKLQARRFRTISRHGSDCQG